MGELILGVKICQAPIELTSTAVVLFRRARFWIMWEAMPSVQLPTGFMIWLGILPNGCMIGMIKIITRSVSTKIREDQTRENGTPFAVGRGIVCLATSGHRAGMDTTTQRIFMESGVGVPSQLERIRVPPKTKALCTSILIQCLYLLCRLDGEAVEFSSLKL